LAKLFLPLVRTYLQEAVMRAYLNQLPTAAWVALGVPALLLAHEIVAVVVPIVVRTVVPETVRTVLHLL
jgi:hypothetical protein